MAEKRKDSRGYLLNSGEHQRSDGRYSFSYTDKEHNRRIIYAKSLVELRQKELKIIKEIDNGLKPGAGHRVTMLHEGHKPFQDVRLSLLDPDIDIRNGWSNAGAEDPAAETALVARFVIGRGAFSRNICHSLQFSNHPEAR